MDKVYEYINKYIEKQNQELTNIDNNISILDKINKFMQNDDLDLLLSLDVDSLDDTLKDDLDIVRFCVDEDLLDTQQFASALLKIKTSTLFSSIDEILNNYNTLKNDTFSNISKAKEILDGVDFDIVFFNDSLDQIDISNQEKLDLLSSVVKSSLPICVEEYKEEVDYTEKINDLNNQYKPLMKDINEVVGKYYYLIGNENNKVLEFQRKYMDITDIKNKNTNSVKQMVILLILKLIDIKKDIDNIISSSKEDYELLELFYDEINSYYEKLLEYIPKLESVITEENLPSSSVLYLLNKDGLFNKDLRRLPLEVKKKLSNIVNKLKGELETQNSSIKGRPLQADDLDLPFTVSVVRSSNMAASYVRLSSDYVLILDFDNYKNIFENAKKIADNERDRILDIQDMAQNQARLEEFMKLQFDSMNFENEIMDIDRGVSL